MMFDVRKCDDEVESEYKCFDNINIQIMRMESPNSSICKNIYQVTDYSMNISTSTDMFSLKEERYA